jgi:DNA topoisomerase VI subunit A
LPEFQRRVNSLWMQRQPLVAEREKEPPRGVRRMLFCLHNELKLPLYCVLDNDFKLEVESLISKDISYVTEQYVPDRLKAKDWLD